MAVLYLARELPSMEALRFDWTELSEHCRALANPNLPATLLAAALVGGIVASYVPQHLRIYRRRSSEGLSPYWVVLGSLSSITAIGNILVLPTSRADIKCCKELSGGACAAALLGVAQIGCQWTCFMIIVLLFLIFYPYESYGNDEDLTASITSFTATPPSNSRRDPFIVGASTFIALFVVAIVSLAVISIFPHSSQLWADILGSISGMLAAIQYIPQIYHTWKIKDLKSLSAMTLAVQAPGSFLFAYSLALRVGVQGWSTWLVYLVTGSLQFVLLGMAAFFHVHDKRVDEDAVHDSDSTATANANTDSVYGSDGTHERTPLLSQSGNQSPRRDSRD